MKVRIIMPLSQWVPGPEREGLTWWGGGCTSELIATSTEGVWNYKCHPLGTRGGWTPLEGLSPSRGGLQPPKNKCHLLGCVCGGGDRPPGTNVLLR